MGNIDPVTLEIIQNRLIEIGREGGYALIRTGASPGIVHTKDLGFNVSDADGRSVVYSMWMPRHGTTLRFMLESTRRRFPDSEIEPGDMFLTNNPHDGALHNLDIAIISPIHYHGELIAWTGCATHHLDIGAVTPGRAPQATDWRQEGLIFPPIKFVEKGRLREDLFEFFLTNVRAPQYQGLDLKGQIAANNVGRERLLQIVERYGVDTLKACFNDMIAISEAKTRERIRQLRPGRYEATQYMQYDKMYAMKCAVVVDGDTLTFDFTGTEPQSLYMVNSAAPCTIANVHNLFICMLVPDLVINEGCFRPLKFILPEKTVLSCLAPAPCGAASTAGSHKAASVALEALSRAVLASEQSWRANASWGMGTLDLTFTGTDDRGMPFFTRAQMGARGGGARSGKDGADAGGVVHSTNQSIANIETMERRNPVLYLYHRYRQDSGGAGRYRGGNSTEAAVKLHGAREAQAIIWYLDRDVPNLGLNGGEAGATAQIRVKRDTNVNSLLKAKAPSFEEIEAKGGEELLPCQNSPMVITDRDVFSMQEPAGGGFGAPSDREAERVAHDVEEGQISVKEAVDKYDVDPQKPAIQFAGRPD
ncbi:MAG: hydantoinase B/oxoprolinase family protein [Chloroflexi bacterium]|nr:hydantoinase B/oxoprolinase family protein [Chloroflexota bacterium]